MFIARDSALMINESPIILAASDLDSFKLEPEAFAFDTLYEESMPRSLNDAEADMSLMTTRILGEGHDDISMHWNEPAYLINTM